MTDDPSYDQEQGERIINLVKHTSFRDKDSCCIDLIEIPNPVKTENRVHRTFTQVFLYKDGDGTIFIDDEPYDLRKCKTVTIHKGQRNRLLVEQSLTMYSVCMPLFNPDDEEKVD